MRARAAIALLLLACACRQQEPREDQRKAALRDTLFVMRKAIDTFYKEQHRYPTSLQELVPKYLTRVPADPFTGSAASWQLVREESVQPNTDFTTSTAAAHAAGGIIDVRSGAAGYSEY